MAEHLTRAQHYKEALDWDNRAASLDPTNLASSDRCRVRAQFHATMAAIPDLDRLIRMAELRDQPPSLMDEVH